MSKIEELCIITAGSVDAGKSTFTGACISNKLDDGAGKLRNEYVAKHKHEIDTGRTSDISVKTIKLNDTKQITFVDLCGHDKYLKTTTFGMTGYFPDYAILLVAGNNGLLKMTKEHLRLLINIKIPFIVMISKEDITPIDKYKNTLNNIKKLGKIGKKLVLINKIHRMELKSQNDYIKKEFFKFLSKDDIIKLKPSMDEYMNNAINDNELKTRINNIKELPDGTSDKIFDIFNKAIEMSTQRAKTKIDDCTKLMYENTNIIPIMTISNKSGYFLEMAKYFLNSLKPRKATWLPTEETIMYIDDKYTKEGFPLILSGIVRGKPIHKNDIMYIVPYKSSAVKVKIKSIHNNVREFVEELGNTCRGCVAVSVIDKKYTLAKKDICKGMILISNIEYMNNICYQFDADVEILEHPTTIKNGFCSVVHCDTIKQSARTILPPDVTLRMKDIHKVTFRFLQKPEFLKEGNIFVSREGKTKIRGCVTKILPINKDPKGASSYKKKINNILISCTKKG